MSSISILLQFFHFIQSQSQFVILFLLSHHLLSQDPFFSYFSQAFIFLFITFSIPAETIMFCISIILSLTYILNMLLASTFAGESGLGCFSKKTTPMRTLEKQREGRQVFSNVDMLPGNCLPSLSVLEKEHSVLFNLRFNLMYLIQRTPLA